VTVIQFFACAILSTRLPQHSEGLPHRRRPVSHH
jgi:hypothetical protein